MLFIPQIHYVYLIPTYELKTGGSKNSLCFPARSEIILN
jgi:hypothetical protein